MWGYFNGWRLWRQITDQRLQNQQGDLLRIEKKLDDMDFRLHRTLGEHAMRLDDQSMVLGQASFDIARERRHLDATVRAAVGRRITAYLAVPQTLAQMKGCLAGGDPFIFGFTCYPGLESAATAKTGIIPDPKRGQRPIGGHDVVFCGYDDSTGLFKIRNSWGADWGQQGYGFISYEYATNPNLSGDFWTVRYAAPVPQPSPNPAPAPPAPQPNPPPTPSPSPSPSPSPAPIDLSTLCPIWHLVRPQALAYIAGLPALEQIAAQVIVGRLDAACPV